MKVVILGLSITSSWGNGHATTFRSLVQALTRRGHDVLFLERDMPWYAAHRDLPEPPWGETILYHSLEQLMEDYRNAVATADLVIVGSFVPDGVAVGEWVQSRAGGIKAFYDIDTPVTLAKLSRGDFEYLHPRLIPGYDLYLSFTGGPTLDLLEREFGSPAARPLYCSFDPCTYFPEDTPLVYDLGYLGTYSDDRQPGLEQMLLEPARDHPSMRFCVAGPGYPDSVQWPDNVQRIDHLPPDRHRSFFNSQRFTLNVTREDMRAAGFAPSVRLFEAAACGTAIISDDWEGLDTIFEPGTEILIARSRADVERFLTSISEDERRVIGSRARDRVVESHTADRRAEQLEHHVREISEHVREPA